MSAVFAAPAAARSMAVTVRNTVVLGLVLLVLAGVAYALLSGKYHQWRAARAEERALVAAGRAAIEAANAQSARDAAANATETRARIDTVVVEVRDKTDNRAERIEAHADPADASGVPDPGVLQDIADAEADYRAARDRLQRPRAR